ncbi:ABC transporter permease [Rhizobium sp. CG4]|uniref:ABC transporter permease n=1 Tax=Rhizobium sp. CG4 TaxID=2726075 RepID=UPI002034192F
MDGVSQNSADNVIVATAEDERFRAIRARAGIGNKVKLSFFLAWYDVRHRYARSIIGPFWITLQTAIFVACIGFVFSAISNVTVLDFLPFFAISFVMWSFLSGTTNNATTTLLGAGGFIKDRGIPAYVFYLQCFFRHLLFLAHNIIVPILLFIFLGGASWFGLFAALPGLLIFVAVTLCLSIVTGVLATRYRDVQPLVESLMNLAFLASPIMWKPHVVAGRDYLLDYNPVVHLLAIWRGPLLDGVMPWNSFGIALALLAVLALMAWYALSRLKNAAFWI